jgi:hypothetical protein
MEKSMAERMAERIRQRTRANDILASRARRLSFIGGLAVGVLTSVTYPSGPPARPIVVSLGSFPPALRRLTGLSWAAICRAS